MHNDENTKKNNISMLYLFFFRVFIIMYLKMHLLDVLFSHFRSHIIICDVSYENQTKCAKDANGVMILCRISTSRATD